MRGRNFSKDHKAPPATSFGRRDVMTPEQRLKAMRANRGRTRIERAFCKELWKLGLRYYTCDGYKNLTGIGLLGKPDLVFPAKRVAIFVDGCFWHGCPSCGIPNGLDRTWRAKLKNNARRDSAVTKALMKQGWTVIRIATHDLKRVDSLALAAKRTAQILRGYVSNSKG